MLLELGRKSGPTPTSIGEDVISLSRKAELKKKSPVTINRLPGEKTQHRAAADATLLAIAGAAAHPWLAEPPTPTSPASATHKAVLHRVSVAVERSATAAAAGESDLGALEAAAAILCDADARRSLRLLSAPARAAARRLLRRCAATRKEEGDEKKAEGVLEDGWRCLKSGDLAEDLDLAEVILSNSVATFDAESGQLLLEELHRARRDDDDDDGGGDGRKDASLFVRVLSGSPGLFRRFLSTCSGCVARCGCDPFLVDAARAAVGRVRRHHARAGRRRPHHLYPLRLQSLLILAEGLEGEGDPDGPTAPLLLDRVSSLLRARRSRRRRGGEDALALLACLPAGALGRVARASVGARAAAHVHLCDDQMSLNEMSTL